ncbi:hypothetical protein SAMN05877831_11616 [Rhodobacter maris]|uniref:Uncharacterized protein n=1 Tax=Rhodobacter maris TaxID=446682 RepID=A0A285T999_9RHOB|nr:hypothetical protein SAMN05877831_11616 [Rhodobacter maris]
MQDMRLRQLPSDDHLLVRYISPCLFASLTKHHFVSQLIHCALRTDVAFSHSGSLLW